MATTARKSILASCGVFLGLIVIGYAIYSVAVSLAFRVVKEELLTANIPEQNCKVEVIYYPGDATVSATIRVQKEGEGGPSTLGVFEDYNSVVGVEFIGDSTMRLILAEATMSPVKRDTVMIDLK